MEEKSNITNTNTATETKLTNNVGSVSQAKIAVVRDIKSVKRIPHVEGGLTSQEVELRTAQQLVNMDKSKRGKTVAGIIVSNILTFFNLIYLVVAVILAIYAQWKNMTFMVVIVANTAIAIAQEIKSKKTLDKLKLVTVPTVKVIRDGQEVEINCDQLVLDDTFMLANGNGISCDSTVVEGTIEVNEAILTGESDAVTKRAGDTLFAGSYVVSGSCLAQVDKVGKYNYISSLTNKAKVHSKPRSQMLGSLRYILIAVAIIILPMTLMLWQVNYDYYTSTLTSSADVFIKTLNKTAGSIISMIPAGPFLLTSGTLALSFIRLAKKKTMAQELYCIEMLARVDTLCLDKTGTITDGTMKVIDTVDLRTKGSADMPINEIMSEFLCATKEDNMTARAMKKCFKRNAKLTATAIVPFSSERKLSAASFAKAGTFILGAPEFVLSTPNQRVSDAAMKYTSQGYRVLVLAQSNNIIHNGKLPSIRRAIALIVIEDHIRKEAVSTIKWFSDNGVDIRVISGDNASTVSNIAKRVGIKNYDNYVSLEGMSDKEVMKIATQYTVFGRVSPDQKALLIKALRRDGRTVAMTGDGVNDILAMKESDCSISLAGGSSASRNVSHLVLMEDNFAVLPEVVAEGRRVVNNIQNATTLYFMKTVYIIVINLMIVFGKLVFNLSMPTPFEAIQIFLLETVVIGLPTIALALQKNTNIIKGHFLGNVLSRCLPASITFILSTVSVYVLKILGVVDMTGAELSTIVALSYTFGGMYVLYRSCRPFNVLKAIMYVAVWLFVVVAICSLPQLWEYSPLNVEQTLLLLVQLLGMPIVLYAMANLGNLINKEKNINKKVKKMPAE